MCRCPATVGNEETIGVGWMWRCPATDGNEETIGVGWMWGCPATVGNEETIGGNSQLSLVTTDRCHVISLSNTIFAKNQLAAKFHLDDNSVKSFSFSSSSSSSSSSIP